MVEIEVTESEVIQAFVARALWLESQMMSALWDAYIHTNRHMDDIFEMILGSRKHKVILTKIVRNMKGIDIPEFFREFGTKTFDYSNLMEEDIMGELYKNMKTVLDFYTKLRAMSEEELINSLWKSGEPKEYFTKMDMLIENKNGNVQKLTPFASRLIRSI
ncbi:MAG: hypothetical protein CVT48_03125 [Thermoplasmata archaeon HGW-Thermoplasmata-1]|nr:MAG: hypothetical protein CVT48_03125 [Thermoplasmata archaeon HGW-Thermoplasmata-1]